MEKKANRNNNIKPSPLGKSVNESDRRTKDFPLGEGVNKVDG